MPASDFFFEIELFLFQLLLELIDLPKRQSVLHCNRHLFGDLAEQLNTLFGKRILTHARNAQHAKRAIV